MFMGVSNDHMRTYERSSPTGVRGQAFFTGQAFRDRELCEECLTGLPAESALAIESRPMP